MRRLYVWAGALLLCAGGIVPPAMAQVPEEERIPVTDPAALERMGFRRDATNVYIWSKANLHQTGGAEERAPEEFGSAKGFNTYMGFTAFSGRGTLSGPGTTHAYTNFNQGIACNAFSSGNGNVGVDAQIQPPHGALLDAIGWWWHNAVPPEQMRLDVYESCMPVQGAGVPTHVNIGGATSNNALPAMDGYANVLINRTVNARSCTYTVRVNFRISAGPCLGDLMATYKIRDEWRRQVSPAPATATFPSDVPLGSPLFRFVEAVAAAGITGGCSPGAYCPDAPLTRGQMAVFLAVALGLNQGGIP
jgi:hypothetical protein